MKTIKKLLCIVIALISIFAFNACEKTYTPATEMDLITIMLDFCDNKLNAKENHEGQRYRITATATSDITEDYVVVTQYTDAGSFRVELYYNEDQIEFVKTLTRDDTVTFEGTLSRIVTTYWMCFEDVVFISEVD